MASVRTVSNPMPELRPVKTMVRLGKSSPITSSAVERRSKGIDVLMYTTVYLQTIKVNRCIHDHKAKISHPSTQAAAKRGGHSRGNSAVGLGRVCAPGLRRRWGSGNRSDGWRDRRSCE